MASPAPKRRGRPPSATLEQFDSTLADQLVDQSLRTISRGSTTRVEWHCRDFPHTFWASVGNRTGKSPTNCGVCAGKVVLPGFNDVATTNPEAAALFVDQSLITQFTAGSNKKVWFKCPDPSHDPWEAPVSRTAHQGSGCGQCSGRRSVVGQDDLATTHPELAAQLVDQSLATVRKAGSDQPDLWKCEDPLHDPWTATANNRVRGNGCPQCSGRNVTVGVNDLATTHPEIAAQMKDKSLSTTISASTDKQFWWVCPNDPIHTWKGPPLRLIKGHGCSVCDNKTIMPGVNDMTTTDPALASRLLDPSDATRVSTGTGKKLRWLCKVDPTHEWETQPSRLIGPRPTGCPECCKAGTSNAELELTDVIRALLPREQIITGDRSILPARHGLDVVVPSYQLAIEYNGVWWHSEANGRGPQYHRTKTRMAADAGYKLVHVWEDDWIDRREIVIRAIAHKLNATHRILDVLPDADPRIAQTTYARQLKAKEVNSTAASQFLETNHIQGSSAASQHFALTDAMGEIWAVLSVGRTNRGSRGSRNEGEWEIQRYAAMGNVPGGFTKLLAHAEKAVISNGSSLSKWITFSAADVSDGGLYAGAGFVVEKELAPDYSYVGPLTGWRRVHRNRFQKRKFAADPTLLWQDGWTEHEAALANKLYRIYDPGKTRWVKEV